MKKIITAVFVFLLVAGGMPVNLYAQMGMQSGMPHMMKGEQKKGEYKGQKKHHSKSPFSINALKAALDLKDKQVVKMRMLWFDYEKGRIRQAAEIKIAELELMELLDQETLDLKNIRAKLEQAGKLQTNLSFFRIEKLQQAKGFLNEKQFKKFKKYSMRRAKHPMLKVGHGMMGSGMK